MAHLFSVGCDVAVKDEKTHSASTFTVDTKLKGETHYLCQYECPSD